MFGYAYLYVRPRISYFLGENVQMFGSVRARFLWFLLSYFFMYFAGT